MPADSKKGGNKPKARPSSNGKKSKEERSTGLSWTYLVLISAVIAVVSYVTYEVYASRSRVAAKLPPISGLKSDTQKWGTYRPHTYFGLRQKTPRSPLFGMMWYEQPDQPVMPQLRHWCDQGDGLSRYSWVAADGRTFGRQNLTEKTAAIRIDWINHEDTWTARISIDALKGRRYAVVFYFVAKDGQTKFTTGHHLSEIIKGSGPKLDDATFSVTSPQMGEILHSTLIWDDDVHLDQLNRLILENTGGLQADEGLVYQLSQQRPITRGKFAAVQLNLLAKTNLEISFGNKNVAPITGKDFDVELKRRTEQFNQKFNDVFKVEGKGYTQVQLNMAKVALSNMIGSVGYWYGSNKVLAPDGKIVPYGPHSLLSGVPSRPFFPRGFLWDEGFHNFLISKFDPEMTIEIFTTWLNTMNEDGWMPREMILGEESEARVPAEFVVQQTNVANPPSMFYVFDQLVHDEKIVEKHGDVLAQMYPRIEKWYKWLLNSQSGKQRDTFRWRGRNGTTELELNPKTLASGLDDYPRASHPSAQEYHLDLRCWLGLGSRVMARLSMLYGKPGEQKVYAKQAAEFADYETLKKLHWSEKEKLFADYGKHSLKVKLVKQADPKQPGQFVVKRVAVQPPELRFVSDAFGYNSLFPVMLRLVPADAPELGEILRRIEDPRELWTDFGLRSLSAKSPYYAARNTEHDPPYWRGYIWINMNYLMLSALQHYGSIEGPNRELAGRLAVALRKNLVHNMAKQFNRTGYIWENYDDRTGEGRGTHPFTGWSSLILLIMGEPHGVRDANAEDL